MNPGSRNDSKKTRPATTATRTRPHNDSKNRFPSVRVGKSVFFAVVAFLLSSRGAFFFAVVVGARFSLLWCPGCFVFAVVATPPVL